MTMMRMQKGKFPSEGRNRRKVNRSKLIGFSSHDLHFEGREGNEEMARLLERRLMNDEEDDEELVLEFEDQDEVDDSEDNAEDPPRKRSKKTPPPHASHATDADADDEKSIE